MMNTTFMWALCSLMFLGIALIVVVIGTTTYLVIRNLIKMSRIYDYPLRILSERFVKGEIDEEEFRQKRKTLTE